MRFIDQHKTILYNSGIMKWVYIEDISECKDQEVEIRGWLYNKRSSGKIRFLLVRDGTGLIQGTIYSTSISRNDTTRMKMVLADAGRPIKNCSFFSR